MASIVTEGPGLIETVLLFDTEAVELLLGLPEAEKLIQLLGLPEESAVLLYEIEAEELTEPLEVLEESPVVLYKREALGVPEFDADTEGVLLLETQMDAVLEELEVCEALILAGALELLEGSDELLIEGLPDALTVTIELLEAEMLSQLLGVPEESAELLFETDDDALADGDMLCDADALAKPLGLLAGDSERAAVLVGTIDELTKLDTLPEDTAEELSDCVLLGVSEMVDDILQAEVTVPQLLLTLGVDDSDATSE